MDPFQFLQLAATVSVVLMFVAIHLWIVAKAFTVQKIAKWIVTLLLVAALGVGVFSVMAIVGMFKFRG